MRTDSRIHRVALDVHVGPALNASAHIRTLRSIACRMEITALSQKFSK